MPTLKEAQIKAMEIIKWLEPRCTRIEIAGSVRRGKSRVKDIEIVCEPIMIQKDLFGEQAPIPLDMSWLGEVLKNGERYKQVALEEGYNLDLFLVHPPAQWGVILTIRTGPDTFSRKMVTQRNKGGWLPSHATVKGGAVWVDDQILGMPNESDFFRFCDLDWVEPEKRSH